MQSWTEPKGVQGSMYYGYGKGTICGIASKGDNISFGNGRGNVIKEIYNGVGGAYHGVGGGVMLVCSITNSRFIPIEAVIEEHHK